MASSTTAFQYTSLYVKISEAKKLPSRDVSGQRDPFCILKIDNETVARTATVFKTLEPFWGEEYSLHVPSEFQDLAVFVYDYDILGSKEPLGKVLLDRAAIIKSPRGLDKWFPLTPISRDDDVQGEILVEFALEYFGEDTKRISMTLVEARDLAARGGGHICDPFATVYYNGEHHSTQVMSKTRFPRWKRTIDLTMPHAACEPLKIVVFDKDKFLQDKFMGQVEMELTDLQIGQHYKTWYRLQHQEPKQKDKKKEMGSLRLKVQCREERILEATLYTPFVQLMLAAVENPSPEGSPLLIMLEDVMTMDRTALGHTLVRFYLAHGSVLPFLDTLTTREIYNTTSPGTLFRANSLASKSFDQFMKIVGLPYLHETIYHVIDTVYNEKKACELDIDTLKQASKVKSEHVAQKTVESSIRTLSAYVEAILDAIFSSISKCPTLLRMALRQLWLRAAEKYKEPEYMDVPYLAITGFMFLRFFVPAILSPKLFAVRDEHPDQRTERTLKLIAKLVQNIGNLCTHLDAKEVYMNPMEHLLPQGAHGVKAFIQDLVQIDQRDVRKETGLKDGGYIHHLILHHGWLFKRSHASAVTSSLQYRKRYFELSNNALLYAQNEKKTGEIKSYPVNWIKLVEKLDEGAFHRKHMFQVVITPTGPIVSDEGQTTLYLQAADVNEQNRWVSVIRKACLWNRDMQPVYHPGAFKKNKWTCCRTGSNLAPGCSQCHRGNTISDWRDPLDPDLDAQVIYSQFSQGRSMLIKKYLPLPEEDGNLSMRDGSTSPTSMTSSGATSLQDQDGGVALSAASQSAMEDYCRDLLEILENISWHHSQIHAP